MYQAPPSPSISRPSGARLVSTARASARRSRSPTSGVRSASGRPMSVAMTLNSDLAAGVKKRILSSLSRNRVATPELSRMFCRSLAVLRWRSSVSCSWLLSAVSSSLSDCSSSREVFSSSLVDWNSSFDRHRFLVGGLQLFVGDLQVVDGALQLLAGGIEFLLELGDPREVSAGSTGRPSFGSCSGSSKKLTSSNSSPSRCTGWTSMRTATALPPWFACAPATVARACSSARLLDHRPELVAQPLARHGEQIPAGLARRHLQITVGRPRVIEALVFALIRTEAGA